MYVYGIVYVMLAFPPVTVAYITSPLLSFSVMSFILNATLPPRIGLLLLSVIVAFSVIVSPRYVFTLFVLFCLRVYLL